LHRSSAERKAKSPVRRSVDIHWKIMSVDIQFMWVDLTLVDCKKLPVLKNKYQTAFRRRN
jgi:hypothetical protein